MSVETTGVAVDHFTYRGYQSPNVAKHHIRTDRCSSCAIAYDVGTRLSIAESTKTERSAGDNEGCAVSRHVVLHASSEEHDVAYHDEGSRSDKEQHAPVKFSAQERNKDREDSADDIWWNSMQLGEEIAVLAVDEHMRVMTELTYLL